MEKKCQTRLIKYLKRKGCYVIKTKPGVGTPVGCPDVIALHPVGFFAFEVKASASAKFRPLQLETIEKLDSWAFAKVVHPDNIDEIISQLEKVL